MIAVSELACLRENGLPYADGALYRVIPKTRKRRPFFVVQVVTEAGAYDTDRQKNGISHTIEFDTEKGAKRYAERHAREHGRKELGPWSS